MKLLLTVLVTVFASLGATAQARPAGTSSGDPVLHRSGVVVSPASSDAAEPAATRPVVLRRSAVVVPGSSKVEYQRALAATSLRSGTTSVPAASSDGLSALAIVLISVGGLGVLCGAAYLGARVVRRHRFTSARIA